MTEEQRENLKVYLDLGTKIALVVAGCFALWKYADSKTKEYQQPLYDAQVGYYFEVVELAARLTTSLEMPQWERDKSRFWELYYGPMILVEDQDVETAMMTFGKCLHDFDILKSTDQMKEKMKELRMLALRLSYACRDSIDDSINANRPSVRLRRDLEK